MRRVKPETKRCSFSRRIWGGSDDHAFDWGVEDNLPGDGSRGHLVVGFVLVEVVWDGVVMVGLVIHHEELVVEGDQRDPCAAEEVGLRSHWYMYHRDAIRSAPIKLKPKLNSTAGFPSDLI